MTRQRAQRQLTMKFAGGLVKHLGLQMYSGAVPAIAELVANAWDAEAPNVRITIPLDQPLEANSVIEVTDDGQGMSFGDCDNKYLVLGRNRRAEEGDYSAGPKKRPLMAHKGIGKLAGFGIADRITVETVSDGRLTRFVLDYQEIERAGNFGSDYHPTVEADEATKEKHRTTIRLTQLKIKRSVPSEQFVRSLLSRFAVYSNDFRVWVNDAPLEKKEGVYQFRFPAKKGQWQEDDVPGFGHIKWWIGFTKDTIPHEDVRGISVLARGKLVQAPWCFGLSGGVYGQHGLQYMTGEVQAEGLDEDVDLVATDRASVLWEDPKARALVDWGQAKVKELLAEWANMRAKTRMERVKKGTRYWDRIQRFPVRERRELTAAIEKLASIPTIEDDRLDELVDFLVKAYENETFMTLIRQLNAASPEAQAEVLGLLKEWDVLEAISTAQIVRGRLEVIGKFEQVIDARVREKPDMHDFLRDHPWLIDPAWTMVEHERRLDTLLVKQFHVKATKTTGGRKRVDFFCLGDASRVVVVEVKRPGDVVGKKELRQLTDYVDFLQKEEGQSTDPQHPRRTVCGYLVAHSVKPEATAERDRLEPHRIFVRPWEVLLRTARETHRHFMGVAKRRAPAEDPRIKALEVDDGSKRGSDADED